MTPALVLLAGLAAVAAPSAAGYEVVRHRPAPSLLGARGSGVAERTRHHVGARPVRGASARLWATEAVPALDSATSPWHTMTRDEHLWDEVVGCSSLLDPDRSGRDYYELEINPEKVECDLGIDAPWPDKQRDIDW
jgi:hypothetical protein